MARTKRISDDELLDAARKFLLERRGRADLNALASVLNLSPATLFHRFGSREALLKAALGPHRHPSLKIPATTEGRPLGAVLLELGLVLDRYFREMLPAIEILSAEGVDAQLLYRIGTVPSSIVGLRALERLIKSARPDFDATMMAAAFTGAVLWRAHGIHHFGDDFDKKPTRAFLKRLIPSLLGEATS